MTRSVLHVLRLKHRAQPRSVIQISPARDPHHLPLPQAASILLLVVIPPRESKSLSPLRFVFKHPLALESETNWFLLLGALDLLGTLVLLRTGAARETNPVAQYILLGGGLQGLIYYKCALLAVVTILVQLIALKHPRVARLVLVAGIAAQLLVVTYSARLIVQGTL